jgi:hypothetical protein
MVCFVSYELIAPLPLQEAAATAKEGDGQCSRPHALG